MVLESLPCPMAQMVDVEGLEQLKAFILAPVVSYVSLGRGQLCPMSAAPVPMPWPVASIPKIAK